MMDKILINGQIFDYYEYASEAVFERDVMAHSRNIFGPESLNIDVKKKIRNNNIVSIPDGYLIDFSFRFEPRLYIIENELVTHDPYKHIGQQLLKFATSYKASGRNIKDFLLKDILESREKKKFVEGHLRNLAVRNIDAFLEELIFEKPVVAVVIIDQITPDLENVLSQLAMKTDIIEFQTFVNKKTRIHKFTPFQQEVRSYAESKKPSIRPEELDTIVVPANEDGFQEVFVNQGCWYAIRISSSMIDRIKYIAGYQTSPVSAVTYYAEVGKIEKYKNTSKYLVTFKNRARKIGPIKHPGGSGIAPQAPRYTTFKKLKKAKTLKELF